MPYSPPSSGFTAVDVPLFRRPTPGDHSASAHQSRHTRTPSASMLNFSTERGPGAHKPLRGLPRRAKPSPAPVVSDPSNTTTTTTDASTPRSLAAFGPPTISRSTRSRPKFSVGDEDSSGSNSTSPKGSPLAENGPGQWTSASTASKGLSIDTTAVYDETPPTVPFPLLSPEPVTTGPPVRRAAIVPLGSFGQLGSFANSIQDDDMATPRSLPSALPPAPSPVPALLSPRLLPVGAQKISSLGASSHGRSASMADVCFDRSRQSSPPASGATTPIVRKSNGQPLKPSLKSSLSSPNISAMNEPRRIAKSAPTTPRVHFKELGLESVVLFDKGARPITVSGEYSGADDTETETETENAKGFPFPQVSTASYVRLAPTTSQLAFQPPPQSHVHLQYLSLPPIRPPRLQGTVLVRNVAFAKTVVVRYTTDNWETASEINASYSSSLPLGIVPGSIDAPWDKFTFTIKLDDIERSLPERTLFCVVKYDAHGVGEWWDNNNGNNYRVEFERPESNGLGLESGPSKIGTGDQSSAPRSFNPLTYNASPAPPMATTKPRSYSTSVVAPPPIKAPPAPLSNGPQPHLLSLRLSNYVSPSLNVPKAPALPKPADKEEPRALDSFSPPSSPEHAKRPLELPESDFGVDFHDSREPSPLKMPATITPPDSAHNSPSSSPPMKRKPLLPTSSLPQSTDNGLLSPSSSPSNSLLITSPPSPQVDDGQAKQPVEDGVNEQNSPSSPPCFLDQAYSELVSRVCFHHSSPGGTPPFGLGVTTSPKGGSPVGSGANSPMKTSSRSGLARGGSYVLGAPGTTPTFIK
ncbi:putative phosphatase regulatory subunit [Rhizoctonia solani 123E]|uniref:Putative phosphatase regulatory subunit n=1 Tax=Rhizoctonia solani 123E TaxID=1423351 RepID=A0A074RZZ2_9AGAM|nr:putative phosphatase regulatory subunit [Rhizoctonia solani 123E]